MERVVHVFGRKVVDKKYKWVVLDHGGDPLYEVAKSRATTPKEAVVSFMEREDRKYVSVQDRVWRDYV
ncbi:MAG: hypothetical protein ACRCZ2_08590 [Fusobacteriaceae bacterium]